jgi:quercetin dioxygenase-like cupin family protein
MEPRAHEPFVPLPLRAGLDVTFSGAQPVRVRAWQRSGLTLEREATHYLYVFEGTATLRARGAAFPLQAGMYAAALDGAIEGQGTGLVVSHASFTGLFQVGGPIEAQGRLRYIDGCTDSLLIAPALRGDPCLNHLHIPAGTRQSRHTHPSLRVGVIARGMGSCVTAQREYPLHAGLAFVIPPDAAHSFWTGGDSLDVVVYHPDSDTGPTHEDHPMINRTILSAR